MTSIAALGPKGSYSWQAAQIYAPDARIRLYPHIGALLAGFAQRETDIAIVPVINTRGGEIKGYFKLMQQLKKGLWVDNVILPINLSLGSLDAERPITMLISRSTVLRQCEDYILTRHPHVPLMTVDDLEGFIAEIKTKKQYDRGIICEEDQLRAQGLVIRERELAPFNRTRFAVLSMQMAPRTGYDATSMITTPLKDRVGLLYDILGEFAKRGVNLLDIRSETDVVTQKLSFYIEAEGHIADEGMRETVRRIETRVIQEPGSIKVLGSYPRLDMRTKLIHRVGFIGTGKMSQWFADRLANEGYQTMLTGRSSPVPPAAMIQEVDVVAVCVPISTTGKTVIQYGPLLQKGQALILLAGEAEHVLRTALANTDEGVEVMLIHNLWGPQASSMKDKNAAVVRTARSGPLCSEFVSFLYKHGVIITEDGPAQHDQMMGITQKLPTEISLALALTLIQNKIAPEELWRHSTLTSLYGILAMARVHSQNPRTYAEIMATTGEGRTIARDFAKQLQKVLDLADAGDIERLCGIIEENERFLGREFLSIAMQQALAVDEALGRTHPAAPSSPDWDRENY